MSSPHCIDNNISTNDINYNVAKEFLFKLEVVCNFIIILIYVFNTVSR